MKERRHIEKTMYNKDQFSQWLGIEILDVTEKECVLEMKVRKKMLNGFGIAHGGVAYSFADTALAFASNNRKEKALSIETSITHLKAVEKDDVLIATARQINRTSRFATYIVFVTNQEIENVAIMKGTVYFVKEK